MRPVTWLCCFWSLDTFSCFWLWETLCVMRLNNHLFNHLIPQLCVLSQVSHSHSIAHDSFTCHLLYIHYVVIHFIWLVQSSHSATVCSLTDCSIHTSLSFNCCAWTSPRVHLTPRSEGTSHSHSPRPLAHSSALVNPGPLAQSQRSLHLSPFTLLTRIPFTHTSGPLA
jgi:hypothetical protein